MASERIKSEIRYELKYLVTWQQRVAVQAELAEQMTPDTHGDAEGSYTITSLYYDTPDHKAYWDKVAGYRMRRKVRVRVYGEQSVMPETNCFLEIKERDYKTLQKRRMRLAYADAVAFDALIEKTDDLAQSKRDVALLQEVYYLYRALHLRPSCVVRYNRLAYNGNQYTPDLRVTFDTDVQCRTHDLTLLSTGYARNAYVLPPHWCIMEIKANQSIPFWLAQVVSRHGCTPRRISKYCAALERSQAILQDQRITY